MKIALFTDSFYPCVGGTETAVMGLANALSKQHQVVVCAPKPQKNWKDNYNFAVFRAKSIKVADNEYLAFPNKDGQFKKSMKEFAPDIIHCHTVSPMTTFAIKYAKEHQVPIIMTLHTKFSFCYKRAVKSKLIVKIMLDMIKKKIKKADAVTTVSRNMLGEMSQYYGYNGEPDIVKNGTDFVPAPLDIELQNAIKAQYNLQNQQNILLFVGLITKYKNLQFLIDSLKILKERNVDFKAIFVGRSMDRPYLEKYAKSIGVHDRLLFTGQITNKNELSAFYYMADLFLFPSIFDTDGLVCVEAAMHGLPVLTLENTGASERIQADVNGFLSSNDVVAYADAVQALLADKDRLKQVGKTAQRTIPKTWDEVALQYVKVYEKTIQKVNTKNNKSN